MSSVRARVLERLATVNQARATAVAPAPVVVPPAPMPSDQELDLEPPGRTRESIAIVPASTAAPVYRVEPTLPPPVLMEPAGVPTTPITSSAPSPSNPSGAPLYGAAPEPIAERPAATGFSIPPATPPVTVAHNVRTTPAMEARTDAPLSDISGAVPEPAAESPGGMTGLTPPATQAAVRVRAADRAAPTDDSGGIRWARIAAGLAIVALVGFVVFRLLLKPSR